MKVYQSALPSLGDPLFHVGISTGKDSTAAMLWALFKSGIPRDRIRVTFSDTGNEDPLTYQHLEILREIVEAAGVVGGIETLIPPLQFFDLAFKKGRFPSRVAQFCSIDLKIEPLRVWLRKKWAEGFDVVLINGKRSSESGEREKAMRGVPERYFSDFWGAEEWTPIRSWSFDDVVAIHREFGVPMHPLYAMGASRVGCWPCINCGKKEIRLVAKHRPEKIEQIANEEKRHHTELGRISTFFHGKTAPERFHDLVYTDANGKKWGTSSIRSIVNWAHTKRGAKEKLPDDHEDAIACSSKYLACE